MQQTKIKILKSPANDFSNQLRELWKGLVFEASFFYSYLGKKPKKFASVKLKHAIQVLSEKNELKYQLLKKEIEKVSEKRLIMIFKPDEFEVLD